MDRLEDLAHTSDYEEEIKRLLNQGHTIEEAEEIYAEFMETVRDLQAEAWHEAYERMQDEGE